MTNLQRRQHIIKTKKQANSFKDFLRDIPSRYPLVLYKNTGLTSLYPDHERSCPVIAHQEFEEQIPALVTAAHTYDHEKTFFENFHEFFLRTPFSALYNYSGAENSAFAFSVLNSKNCYLSFTVITDCENIVYSFAVKEGCRNIFASSQVSNYSENVWQSSCVVKGYQIFYSKFIKNCRDVRFSANMLGCQECLFCDGLENQSYCIENIQYTKEEYYTKKSILLAQTENYDRWYDDLSGVGKNLGSTNITNGNFVLNSEDVENGMYSFNLKDARNTLVVGSPNPNEHIYDAFEAGSLGNSHLYGVMNTGVNSEHVYNSEGIVTCYNVYYSRFLENCKYCLGCIGLRNQEYCILNKQYTKEEWFEMVERIFQQMEEAGVLGDYFPGWLCPFYFNDTVAFLVGDFSKEEVEAEGYLRRDEEIAVDIPEWMEVVEVGDLKKYEGRRQKSPPAPLCQRGEDEKPSLPKEVPNEGEAEDFSWHIDPAILKKVVRDEEGNVYRVIKMEYDFLMKYGLPLPRKHWLERLKGHFSIQ